jgi:hypothetical protein
MVAFQVADGAMVFLPAAPGDKIPMDFLFVAGHGNPKIKNVTQENQIPVISLEGFKHLKKKCLISIGFADVGIRDDDHLIMHALVGNIY